MIHHLVQYLADSGWDADAVFIDPQRSVQAVDGVTVYTRRSGVDMDDLVARCDVIVTHLGATPIAKKLGKQFGKPVVQLVHNTNEFTVGFLGSGCDMAIYNAEWVRDHHGSVREQAVIQVWENKNTAAWRVRTTTEWPSVLVHPPVMEDGVRSNPDGKYITLVNLVHNKGPDVFYALAEMNPDLQFMGVVGGYEEDKQVIRDLPNVTIHPHTANQDDFYSKTRVILAPSIYESYGRVGVEAMRYGIPTLASPTPGLVESLGSSGRFAPRDDTGAWDVNLHHILDNYTSYARAAHARFLALRQQSISELAHFAEVMTRVGHGAYRNI